LTIKLVKIFSVSFIFINKILLTVLFLHISFHLKNNRKREKGNRWLAKQFQNEHK